MGYTKANDVLPRELLRAVQRYIDGAYLYIPRQEHTRRAWGETTHSRERVRARNECIASEYAAGSRVTEIAQRYFLSEKTVYKIVNSLKNK